MAEVVAFQAGGGRKRVQEAEKAKEEELTELAKRLLHFAQRLGEMAERTQPAADGDGRAATATGGGGTSRRVRWEEAIDHLSLFLSSATGKIRETAAATIAIMAKSRTTQVRSQSAANRSSLGSSRSNQSTQCHTATAHAHPRPHSTASRCSAGRVPRSCAPLRVRRRRSARIRASCRSWSS